MFVDRRWIFIAGITALISGIARGQAAGDLTPIQVFTYDDPPFIIEGTEGGPATGRLVEVVRGIFSAADMDMTLSVMPVRRAFASVQPESRTCAFSFAIPAQNAESYRWFGPIHRGGWALFTAPGSDDDTGLKSVADLADDRIIVGYGGPLSDELQAAGLNVVGVSDSGVALNALYAGRVEYIAGGMNTIPAEAGNLGFEAPQLVHLWRRVEFYLVCSQAISDLEIKALQAEVDRIHDQDSVSLSHSR